MLCCHDIANHFTFKRLQCYTFGAPRPANNVWVKEYNQLVPDTWHVMNGRVSLRLIDVSHAQLDCENGITAGSLAKSGSRHSCWLTPCNWHAVSFRHRQLSHPRNVLCLLILTGCVVTMVKQLSMDVQDIVPRQGRLLGFYKQPGQRVRINVSSDLIVRPSFLEARVLNSPWGRSCPPALVWCMPAVSLGGWQAAVSPDPCRADRSH